MDYNKPPFQIGAVDDLQTFENCYEEDLLQWFDTLQSCSRNSKKEKTTEIEKLTESQLHQIFNELVKRLNDSEFSILHKYTFGDNLQPSFVFNQENMPTNPFYCSFMVELQTKDIDVEHKGRLLQYHKLFLLANPDRQYISSLLTNLKSAVIIKTKREDDDSIEHFEWPEIPFWPNKTSLYGLRLLNKMIKDPECVGYDGPGIHFEIDGKMFFVYKY